MNNSEISFNGFFAQTREVFFRNSQAKKEQEPKKFKIISADVAQRTLKKGIISEIIGLQNSIIVVDFSKYTFFTDPNAALFCVEVMTSNGNIGTISHLQIDADTEAFSQALRSIYQIDTQFCLSGGEVRISDALITKVQTDLQNQGFSISPDQENSDTGGVGIYRQATLYPSKVEINRRSYIENLDNKTLYF